MGFIHFIFSFGNHIISILTLSMCGNVQFIFVSIHAKSTFNLEILDFTSVFIKHVTKMEYKIKDYIYQ